MDNKISTYSPAFSIVSWIALVGGIVTYLLGLWNAEMQLRKVRISRSFLPKLTR
ncbi:Inner membrane protein yiaA [Escherichia coli]|nr:Inner membrane protein yiaA [Escherichia coli]